MVLGKQVRSGIEGSSRVGVLGRVSGLTRRGTGDRDQSQSGRNCSRTVSGEKTASGKEKKAKHENSIYA